MLLFGADGSVPSVRAKILIVCLFVSLLGVVGCNTFFKEMPETIPGYTNVVVTVGAGGSLQTNVITRPTITITNWVKGEGFEVAEGVSGVIPIYGEIAMVLIGLAGSIYLDWRNKRNKKAAVSTIRGVAQFRTALKASGDKGVNLDNQLTKSLEQSQLEIGIKEYVDKMIKVHVGKKEDPTITEELRKAL